MKVQMYNFKCGDCSNSYKSPFISGEVYGEFLMRSQITDEIVYLDANLDKIFSEVADIFDELLKKKESLFDADDNLFYNVFSSCCDPSDDGSYYSITIMPKCVHCGSRKPTSWKLDPTKEYYNKEVKKVTHNYWSNLLEEEKTEYIKALVKKFIDTPS